MIGGGTNGEKGFKNYSMKLRNLTFELMLGRRVVIGTIEHADMKISGLLLKQKAVHLEEWLQ